MGSLGQVTNAKASERGLGFPLIYSLCQEVSYRLTVTAVSRPTINV